MIGLESAREAVKVLDAATMGRADEDKLEHAAKLLSRYDGALVNDTIRRLCASDSYWPSENRIRHVLSEVMAAREADLALPPPRSDMDWVHPDVTRANLVVLREVQSKDFQARLRVELDRNPGGWTEADRGEAIQGIVYDRVKELTGREPFPDPSSGKPPRVDGYRCGSCRDQLWVEEPAADGTLEVVPCPSCAPVNERRWREGHFRLNHNCAECSNIRKQGADALA